MLLSNSSLCRMVRAHFWCVFSVVLLTCSMPLFSQVVSLGHERCSPPVERLHSKAQAAKENADWEKAQRFYCQALAVAQRHKDRRGEAMTLINLGDLALLDQRLQDADKFFLNAQDAAQRYHLPVQESDALTYRGKMEQERGNSEKSKDYLQPALRIAHDANYPEGEAAALTFLGSIALNAGSVPDAVVAFEKAADLFVRAGNEHASAYISNNLASIDIFLSAPTKALPKLEKILPIFRKHFDLRGEGIALENIGAAYAQLQQRELALSQFQKALALYRQAGALEDEAKLLTAIGAFFLNHSPSSNDAGLPYLLAALDVYDRIFQKAGGTVAQRLQLLQLRNNAARNAAIVFWNNQRFLDLFNLTQRTKAAVLLSEINQTEAVIGGLPRREQQRLRRLRQQCDRSSLMGSWGCRFCSGECPSQTAQRCRNASGNNTV